MTDATMTRRAFVRRASGLVLALGTGGGLVAAGARGAEAAGGCPYCASQWGPIHRWLWAYGVAPRWQHDVCLRESGFDPGATNPRSGAAGIVQFMAGTWASGEERFGIYGSPYDWPTALTMMNAYLEAGEWSHWWCNGEYGCEDV